MKTLSKIDWSAFMTARSITRRFAYQSYLYACGEVVAGRMAAYWVGTITEKRSLLSAAYAFEGISFAFEGIVLDSHLAHLKMKWMREYNETKTK